MNKPKMKFKSLTFSAILAVLAVFALLSQTACKSGAFIPMLNAVVVATGAAVSTLSTSGAISPAESVLIVNYLDAVSTASASAAAELASNDSVAEKSRKIAEAFAVAALPNLPGVTPEVAKWVKAVDLTVQAFLANFKPPKLQAYAVTSARGVVVKPSFAERRQLAGIRSHAEKVKAKLAKLSQR